MSNHHVKVVHPFNRSNLFYEVSSDPPRLTFYVFSGIRGLTTSSTPLMHKVRYHAAGDTAAQMEDVFNYISGLHRRRNRPSSGIIYCRTRATCSDLSHFLRGRGLNSKPYHKGIKYAMIHLSTLTSFAEGICICLDLMFWIRH